MPLPKAHFGDFHLDFDRRELWRLSETVPLEERPMEILMLLVSAPGQLIERAKIIEVLYGAEPPKRAEQVINNSINRIRTALGDNPDNPQFIKTVVGKGYLFLASVTRECDCPAKVDQPVSQSRFETALLHRAYPLTSIAAVAMLLLAIWTSTYGLAIAGFCICGGLLTAHFDELSDKVSTRFLVSLFYLLGMAYTPSAATLYPILARVTNISKLPIAVVYPFVTGLKFIPAFVLVFAYWVILKK